MNGSVIEMIKNDEKLIMQIIERVLLSSVADTSSDVRLQIIKEFSLQPIFDEYLLLDDNLQTVIMMTKDERLKSRRYGYITLGRLAHKSPNQIVPSLRVIITSLTQDIQHSTQKNSADACAQLLGDLIRAMSVYSPVRVSEKVNYTHGRISPFRPPVGSPLERKKSYTINKDATSASPGSNGIFIQDLNEALIDFDNTNMPKVESRPIFTDLVQQFTPQIFQTICSKFLNDMSSAYMEKGSLYLDSQVNHDNVNDHWNRQHAINNRMLGKKRQQHHAAPVSGGGDEARNIPDFEVQKHIRINALPLSIMSLIGEISRVDPGTVSPYIP